MSETSLETTFTACNFSELYREEEDYWWSAARRRLVSRFLWKYSLSQNPKIIDVGCGGGGLLGSLKGHGSILGLEHSALGAASAAEKTGGRIVRGDAENLPFKDGCFDVLTSLDVIEHLDDVNALRDFYRVLSSGGIIILTVPALNSLWSPRDLLLGHKRRYTVKKMRQLLEKTGFKVMKCSYTNSFYFPGLLIYGLLKRLFKQKATPRTAIMSLPSWISILFDWILKAEENILMYANLPIGTSILCVARKSN